MATQEKNTSDGISRRDFLKTSAAFGGGLLLKPQTEQQSFHSGNTRIRYAIVGTGIRHTMYRDAILKTYKDDAELVGLCDSNEGRLRLSAGVIQEGSGQAVPVYLADKFDEMVKETRPDTVIVTTMDSTHDRYIIRAMELGCDVVTEKPMTTTAEACQNIIDTQKKTGKSCIVTFNYRYSPPRTQIKKLLMDGTIGEILSLDFEWLLNTHHGADYFRRWHSEKRFSGGLMVHKATHHFDLVNWWLSAIPVSVFAFGKREFYTPDMAKRFGLQGYHQRCHTCPEKEKCGFHFDLAASNSLKALYLDNEQYDGYQRDRCVFRPDIDIEDTMSVVVQYDNAVTMSYSLNAFNSWEGYNIVFNGTKGRIEHTIEETIYVSGTETEQGGLKSGGVRTTVIPLRAPAYEVDPWSGEGGHGGGDRLLLDDIFLPNKAADPYHRRSDQRGGAYSILTGIAANQSIASARAVQIADLVSGIGYPDYAENPSRSGPLPMPGK